MEPLTTIIGLATGAGIIAASQTKSSLEELARWSQRVDDEMREWANEGRATEPYHKDKPY